MEAVIQAIVTESIRVKREFFVAHTALIAEAAGRLAACLRDGGKILIFGNGGSAADAQHIAAEFVNRFQIERPPLAALALTTDTSILTSIGNDYDFREIFAKQVRALGKPGDIAIGISTSGNSPNVVEGILAAREMGLAIFGLTGRGGRMADLCDCVFAVPSPTTARIQETHITLGHVLCDLVDRILYSDSASV